MSQSIVYAILGRKLTILLVFTQKMRKISFNALTERVFWAIIEGEEKRSAKHERKKFGNRLNQIQ